MLDISAVVPPLSGIGRYALEMARRLPDQPGVDRVRFLRGAAVTDVPEAAKRPAPASPSWRKLVKPLLPYHLLVAPYRRRKSAQLARELDRFDDHVFHWTNFAMPPVSSPSVATIHDMSVFFVPEFHPRDRVNYLREQISHSVERADRLVTDSESVRSEILDYFNIDPDRVVAIPLGVDDSFQPRGREALAAVLGRHGLQPGGYLLSVGTIEPRKNLRGLLRAYGRLEPGLRQRYPLVIAGAYGWKGASALGDIRRMEASGDVVYLDYVAEAELPLLYAGAAAFCYFSFYEGFGLPVLESLASNVPVVGADIPALRELGGGDALLVNPRDIDAMHQALERAVTDAEWRAAAIKRGTERSRWYTWENTASRLAALFADIGS